MTIAVDPIISNIVFTLSFLMHLRAPTMSPPFLKPTNGNGNGNGSSDGLPVVSVLVPVFKERYESIRETAKSIAFQTYPKAKLETIFIVEPDDIETVAHTARIALRMKRMGIPVKVVSADGNGSKLKPHALNNGLREAKGEIVVVYDADDSFPPEQIEEAVNLMMEKGYDVLQPKIERARDSIVGKYLMLDTFVWERKFIPAFYRMGGVFPLSGEALFIRRSVLDEVGGFPEVLTEDAYLAILLAEKRKRFGLLDSTVKELGPKSWSAHSKQRLRWFRGYLQCLGRTLTSKMPWRAKLTFMIPFAAPLTCAFSLITWILFVSYWGAWLMDLYKIPHTSLIGPWMVNGIYASGFFYWSAFLAYIGNPIVVFSYMHSIAGTKMEKYAPLAITIPLYWMFLGAIATLGLFKSLLRKGHEWGKTER